MNIFPLLHTSHLKLRKIEVEDIPALVKYADNKKISDNIINIPHPYREPDAAFRLGYVMKGFKERSRFVFAIEHKALNHLIGEISLHLERDKAAQLGYWIGEPFWGKGYAKEAVEAIAKFGFETLELGRIYAECHEENIASHKVVEANGFNSKRSAGMVRYYEKVHYK